MTISTVRFIGCIHLGHRSIAVMRGFANAEEHDEHLIKNWNSVVGKKDTTYILGDVTMEKDLDYYKLDLLNGRKKVVLGNHDMMKHVPKLLLHVDGVAGMVDYKGFALTHAPIHPSEMGGYRGNIHAHIHDNVLHEVEVPSRYSDEDSVVKDTLRKYYNVDAHRIGYKPKTIDELLTEII
jgi:calcineurin-like phosphoesterase family protein